MAAVTDTGRPLARDPSLALMYVARAAAYRDRFPFLTTLVLPEGAIDLRQGLPEADKRLIATAELGDVSSSFAMEQIKFTTALPL